MLVVDLAARSEYDTTPAQPKSKSSKPWSDAGVKLILGGHPHVLQPMQWLGKQTFAIYSQASFMSGPNLPG